MRCTKSARKLSKDPFHTSTLTIQTETSIRPLNLRRRRFIRPFLRDPLHRHKPRLPLLILPFLLLERILPNLRVRPRRPRIEPIRDISEAISVSDDDDLFLWTGAQPAAVPSGAGLEGRDGGCVEALFRGPVGGEGAEVEAGELGICFEGLARLWTEYWR